MARLLPMVLITSLVSIRTQTKIILASAVVYELGDYFIELRSDTEQGLLTDLAGNALFQNAEDSNGRYTSFALLS